MKITAQTKKELKEGDLNCLKSRAIHVYFVLLNEANDLNCPFKMTLDEISHRTGLVKNPIQSAIKELVQVGFIEKTVKGGLKGRGITFQVLQ